MSKRNIGIVIIILLIVVVVLLFGPYTVDPQADSLPDDLTGPGQEGMLATGTVETPAAGPEVRPEPGEQGIR